MRILRIIIIAVVGLTSSQATAEPPAPIDLQLPRGAVDQPTIADEIAQVVLTVTPACERYSSRATWGNVAAVITGGIATGLGGGSLAAGDDLSLGLQISGIVLTAVSAGAVVYARAQAKRYQDHCDVRRRILVGSSGRNTSR